MLRTAWVALAVVLATIWYGGIAIGASLIGIRGGLYVWATRAWSRAIMRASGCSVQVSGTEHLLRDAPQIIVSNHTSWFDVFALASVLPVPFHFVAKKELENILLFGRAWKAAGHISLDRSNRKSAAASLHAAGEKIAREKSAVIIFPEGTRSRTGELQPFKKGAFVLAVEGGVPVIPTTVTGSYEIMPPGSWVLRPRTVSLRFGEPIVPGNAVDDLLDTARARLAAMLEETTA